MKKIFKEILPTVDSSFIVQQEITTQFANPFHFHDGYELTFIIFQQLSAESYTARLISLGNAEY